MSKDARHLVELAGAGIIAEDVVRAVNAPNVASSGCDLGQDTGDSVEYVGAVVVPKNL